MSKNTICILYTLNFYFRLCLIAYILYNVNANIVFLIRHSVLKILLMNFYTFAHITYIMMTKNYLQLKLYKKLLFVNMFVVYYIFTKLDTPFIQKQLYIMLIIFDVFIEIYADKICQTEFIEHYSKIKGLEYSKYTEYVKRQKAIFCFIVYSLNVIIDMMFVKKNIYFVKIIFIFMIYFSFIKKKISTKILLILILFLLLNQIHIFIKKAKRIPKNHYKLIYEVFFRSRTTNIKVNHSTKGCSKFCEMINRFYEILLLSFIFYYVSYKQLHF